MEEILFGTRNYNYDEDTTLSTPAGTSVGVNTPDKAKDALKSTAWETTDALPQLDSQFVQSRTINSLFFRHENVSQYRIQSSPDGVIWSDIDSGLSPQDSSWGHNFEFTADTKPYWRFQIDAQTVPANTTKIFELFWFEMKIKWMYDATISDLREARVDRGGGVLRTLAGRVITFTGTKGVDSLKEHLMIGVSMVVQADYDSLYALWSAPLQRLPFVISPFVDNRERTFEAAWVDSRFPLTTDGKRPQLYYSAGFEIEER